MRDIKTLHFITPNSRALSRVYSVRNASQNIPFTSHPPLLTEHDFAWHYTSNSRSRSWSAYQEHQFRHNCDSCHSQYSLSANAIQGGQGGKFAPCLGVFKEPRRSQPIAWRAGKSTWPIRLNTLIFESPDVFFEQRLSPGVREYDHDTVKNGLTSRGFFFPKITLKFSVFSSWLSRPQVGAWFSASQLIGGMEALFLVMIQEILSVRDSMWQQYSVAKCNGKVEVEYLCDLVWHKRKCQR